MTESNAKTFVSSIKIKGLHFLPPVITEEKRIELQKYKQQAIRLEKRLQHYKELQSNLQGLLDLRSVSQQSHTSLSEVSFNTNSHIKALEISPKLENTPNRSQKQLHLSTDIIDVTEYSSSGIKILDSKQTASNQNFEQCRDEKLYKPTSPITVVLTPASSSDNSIIIGRSPLLSPIKPRLIRSNSYTLDNPSPILLAHFEKYCENKSDDREIQTDEVVDSNSTPIKGWSSSDDNFTSFENSEYSSLSTVYQKDSLEKSERFLKDRNEINRIQKPFPHIENEKEIDSVEKSYPQIELIHADISVQHVTVHNNIAEEKEIKKSTFELSDPNNQLLDILRNIPEDYSRRIIDLIEKERLAQIEEMEASKREMDTNGETELNPNCEDLKYEFKPKSSVGSPDKISSCAGSISPSVWSQHSQLIQVMDLDCDNKSSINDYYDSEISPRPTSEDYILSDCKKKLVFNPEQNISTIRNIKREWAASIICAYVKGYLTRRLLKTGRVQSLISTIRDALLCALQLHSADNIDETDIELHRRLINQGAENLKCYRAFYDACRRVPTDPVGVKKAFAHISVIRNSVAQQNSIKRLCILGTILCLVTAACYAFHDIFFSFSISEQMYMISTDRQHKHEKAKRPVSAPQPRRPSSIRKKQRTTSLTKSVTNV